MSQSKISRIEAGLYKKILRREIDLLLKGMDASDEECRRVKERLGAVSAAPYSHKLDTRDTVHNRQVLNRYYCRAKRMHYYVSGTLPSIVQVPASILKIDCLRAACRAV